MRRAVLFIVPLALLVAFALGSFLPAGDSIPGWGGDPAFNLWTYELVWHRLGTLGPLRMFSDVFWAAPLFGGVADGLAFSENQLYPALLLWPLRALGGNGAWTLGAGAPLFLLLAGLCAAGWLRALGLRTLFLWGGLLFASCGWLQSQYAHYQNLFIFLLPLALWAWIRFAERPSRARLILCALAFGWIGGWNLYFQLFADAMLAVLVLLAARRKQLPLSQLALLAGLALLVQWPIARHYLALGARLGGYRTLETYGATLASLLGQASRPTLLQRFVPFYPSLEVPIESAGFLGFAWLSLMLVAASRERSRPWLLASALTFWIALGYGHGLFDLLALLPGVAGLRAIGRLQIASLLFSLPAVLGLLEEQAPKRAATALGLVLLELVPGERPARTPIPPAIFGAPLPLARAAAASDAPLLVLPGVDPELMLELGQLWTPYFGGLSGRFPPGEELLAAITERRPWGPGSLVQALELTGAGRVLALTPALAEELRDSHRAQSERCLPRPEGSEACLFELKPGPALPSLRLARDTTFSMEMSGRWPVAELRANAPGVLRIADVDRCRLRQTLRFPFLPALRHELPLQGSTILGTRFAAGEVVLRRELRQAIFRLPGGLRPAASFELLCEAD